ELLIKELLLRVWSHKKDSLATIKIHLYPVDIAHKKIGYDLLDSLTVKPASTRYQLLHLNVSSKEIYMPENGVLLSVENITHQRRIDIGYKFNKNRAGTNSYILNVKKDHVRIYQALKNNKQFRDYNLMFGIAVEVE